MLNVWRMVPAGGHDVACRVGWRSLRSFLHNNIFGMDRMDRFTSLRISQEKSRRGFSVLFATSLPCIIYLSFEKTVS